MRLSPRTRRGPRRALATAAAGLALAAFSCALPSSAATPNASGPKLAVARAGRPLLAAAAMAPGSRVHRTVSVANRGDRAGMLSIGVAVTGQPAGAAAGLSDALQISVTDADGRLLAGGTLRGFGNQALERIPAGAARSVTVSVALPAADGASGGRVSADIVWTLTEAQ